MQKKFRTISDYHRKDPGIRVNSLDLPHLRISLLHEGSGDIRFARTDRDGLVMTLDGSAAHLTRMDGLSDETPSQAGDICLIPTGVEVRLAWTNHAPIQRSVMIEFDKALFQTVLPEIDSDRFLRGHLVPANFATRPALGNLMHLLAREIDPDHRRGRLFADSAARLLALELAATCWTVPVSLETGPGVPDARIARAIDYIEASFTEDLSILDIAAVAGLSPTQLGRSFRAATGLTPYAYVIARRLRYAAQLLRGTTLPIAIVALEAGFTDQAHLTRIARQRLGRTPRQIRVG
jgi:AraC family transcriptional regulator